MPDAASGGGPVIVGGAVASASRRVHALLAAHPAMGRDLDFAVYAEAVELRRRMRRSIERGFIDLFCSEEELDARLRALLDGLERAGAVSGDGPRLCGGDPDSGARLADLAALLPGARLVHAVGDPRRAVAAALRAGPAGLPGGGSPMDAWWRLEMAVRRVRRALAAGFEAARRAPERVHTLSLAHLAARPEEEARRLCTFLGLPWDDALAAPLDALVAEVAVAGGARSLSAGARVRVAERLARPELEAAGYPLGVARLPAAVRWWGRLTRRIGLSALEARRRLRRAREARRARRASPAKGST